MLNTFFCCCFRVFISCVQSGLFLCFTNVTFNSYLKVGLNGVTDLNCRLMEKFLYCPFSIQQQYFICSHTVITGVTDISGQPHNLMKTHGCFLPCGDLSHADQHEKEKAADPKAQQKKVQKGVYSLKQQLKKTEAHHKILLTVFYTLQSLTFFCSAYSDTSLLISKYQHANTLC